MHLKMVAHLKIEPSRENDQKFEYGAVYYLPESPALEIHLQIPKRHQELKICYEGLAYSRNKKAKDLAAWPDAMKRLRPCWKPGSGGKNCGKCVRCIGTALCFSAEGVSPPDTLNVGSLTNAIETLSAIKIPKAALQRLADSILEPAKSNQISEPWVDRLEKLIIRKQRQLQRKQLRRDLREFFCSTIKTHRRK